MVFKQLCCKYFTLENALYIEWHEKQNKCQKDYEYALNFFIKNGAMYELNLDVGLRRKAMECNGKEVENVFMEIRQAVEQLLNDSMVPRYSSHINLSKLA